MAASVAGLKAGDGADSRLRKPSPEIVIEEYDFCNTSENAVPTLQEVEAVSKQLHESFAGKDGDSEPAKATATAHQLGDEVVINEVARENNTATNSGPLLSGCSASNHHLAPRSSAVVQCMNLFQRDPQVQAAVMSLARDPALWDAFVRNKKVQELLRERRRPAFDDGGKLDLLHHHVNPFVVAAHCFKDAVWGALDSIVDVVHGAFGFLDRLVFGGRQSEALDKPFKACMVLTMLVFSLVLLNRGRR